MKDVEGEVDQIDRVAFRQGILQGGEARDAIGPKDRNLAVQISGLDGQRGQRRCESSGRFEDLQRECGPDDAVS